MVCVDSMDWHISLERLRHIFVLCVFFRFIMTFLFIFAESSNIAENYLNIGNNKVFMEENSFLRTKKKRFFFFFIFDFFSFLDFERFFGMASFLFPSNEVHFYDFLDYSCER